MDTKNQETRDNIVSLIKRAATATDSAEAQRYGQAAANAAQALSVLCYNNATSI